VLDVLVTVGAVCAAFTAIVAFPPTRRTLRWLWRRNVSEPLTVKADEIVSTVVVRELKQRNDGSSLIDLGDKVDRLGTQVHDIKNQLVVVRGTQVMHTERLVEVARKADMATRKAEEAVDRAALLAESVHDQEENE
jgi:hypothetical protein